MDGKWRIDENGNLVAETITAKKARLNELEMVDKATGAIYCTWIENGEWTKIQGACGSATSINSEVEPLPQAPLEVRPQTTDATSTEPTTVEVPPPSGGETSTTTEITTEPVVTTETASTTTATSTATSTSP